MATNNGTTFTSFTAEFTAVCYEPRAKNHARLVTCTKQDGGVRVKIECESAGYVANAPFVTLSDEFIPDAMWPVIRDLFKQTTGFKVVKRA